MSKKVNFVSLSLVLALTVFTVNCGKKAKIQRRAAVNTDTVALDVSANTQSNNGSDKLQSTEAKTEAKTETKTQENKAEESGADKSAETKSTTENKTESKLSAKTLDKVHCENDLILELEAPIAKKSTLKNVKWNLESIRLNVVDQDDNGSFSVVADKADEFEPQISCNGLSNLSDANFERSYTDENGGKHTEKSSANSKKDASFAISEWIDLAAKKSSENKRKIAVFFENGKLVKADSLLVPAGDEYRLDDNNDEIKIERMEAAPDTFLTLNGYQIAESILELRMKVEYPAEDGKRTIHHAVATFLQEKSASTTGIATSQKQIVGPR